MCVSVCRGLEHNLEWRLEPSLPITIVRQALSIAAHGSTCAHNTRIPTRTLTWRPLACSFEQSRCAGGGAARSRQSAHVAVSESRRRHMTNVKKKRKKGGHNRNTEDTHIDDARNQEGELTPALPRIVATESVGCAPTESQYLKQSERKQSQDKIRPRGTTLMTIQICPKGLCVSDGGLHFCAKRPPHERMKD